MLNVFSGLVRYNNRADLLPRETTWFDPPGPMANELRLSRPGRKSTSVEGRKAVVKKGRDRGT